MPGLDLQTKPYSGTSVLTCGSLTLKALCLPFTGFGALGKLKKAPSRPRCPSVPLLFLPRAMLQPHPGQSRSPKGRGDAEHNATRYTRPTSDSQQACRTAAPASSLIEVMSHFSFVTGKKKKKHREKHKLIPSEGSIPALIGFGVPRRQLLAALNVREATI